jgi:hypothetical protein
MDVKPERRWFHYSLRTLLLFVAIASAGFGWLGMKVRAKQREREAVKAIDNSAGYFAYGYQLDAGRNRVAPVPPGPAWLRKLVGDDFFADVEVIGCGHRQLSDKDLSHLRVLPGVKELELGGCELTDAGLAQIEGLSRLKNLWLYHTLITDTGLVHLEGLTSLESLDLRYTKVTDAGLSHLHKLTRLKQISLVGTKVTDGGVEELQMALPNLKTDHESLVPNEL